MKPLSNWHVLNKELSAMTEEQVKALLDEERAGKKRPDIMLRLHQRFTTLRKDRERRELLR